MVGDPLTFITGFVATKLTQKTADIVWKGTRRAFGAQTAVHKSLVAAVKAGVGAGLAHHYGEGSDEAASVQRALLERNDADLPLVDGTPLTALVDAVRLWVVTLEAPVDAAELVGEMHPDHPLVGPLSVAILVEVQEEATRGAGNLARLWDDFRHQETQQRLERRDPASGPEWQEYWNPELPAVEFTGRARELEELDFDSEIDDGIRLVCSVGGIGGVGKTALAVEYATRNAASYPDGRIYFNFHSYSGNDKPISGSQAIRAILQKVLGDATPAGRLDQLDEVALEAEWRRAAHGKRLIMIWDNVRATDQIQPLLLRQAGCKTIVTSRARLDMPRCRTMWLDTLPDDDAISLFTVIAGTAHDPGTVAGLVEADMNMPVLIEAHARLVRSGRRQADQVLDEIEQLPRDKTKTSLYGRLAGSYAALNDAERQMFHCVGIHHGTFISAGAAAAMVKCDVYEAIEILDALHDIGLLDTSHISGITDPADRYAYSGHDVIIDYATDCVGKLKGQFELAWPRLVDYYYKRLNSEEPEDVAWLRRESTNVMIASQASYEFLACGFLGQKLGMRLLRIGRFWDASLAFMSASDVFNNLNLLTGCAIALTRAGKAASMAGDDSIALFLFEEAVKINETGGREKYLADTICEMGNDRIRHGAFADAESHFSEAARICRSHGHEPELAKALSGLGTVALSSDEFADAELLFQESMSLYDAHEDSEGRANAAHGLGKVAQLHGDLGSALPQFELAAIHSRNTGNTVLLANALEVLGEIQIEIGRPCEARDALNEAGEIFGRNEMRVERDRVWTKLEDLRTPAEQPSSEPPQNRN